MMRRFLFLLPLLIFGKPAFACPDYELWGREQYAVTAAQLMAPAAVEVVAGGDFDLSKCGIKARNWRGALYGYFIREPDFSIRVTGLNGYELEFRIVSTCDTTLLLNTAGANWYFDDDDNTASPGNPKIHLSRPSGDGIYDVWIGTFDGRSCDARLILETF